MRTFASVSASQLYNFRDCKRLWWLLSVLGLEIKQRASAELGTTVHGHAQKYLDNGTPPPDDEAGRILRPALTLLPPPETVYTEVKLNGEHGWPRPDIDGVPCNGFVDVLDFVNEQKDRPRVLDLKTTSNLKYAKSEAELLTDPQGLIYGKFALGAYEHMGAETDKVDFGHVVVLTRGAPLAKRTTVTLTRRHIEDHWRSDLVPDVRAMREVARVERAEDVPGNAESCSKYGGCHFRDRCRALGMAMAVEPEVPAFISRRFASAPLTPAPALAMSGVILPSSLPPPESSMSDAVSAPLNPMEALARLRAKRAAENAAGTPPAPEQSIVTPPAPSAPAQAAQQPGAGGSDAKAAILAKYGIKPAALSSPSAEPPAQPLVPADAPPQVARIAQGESNTEKPAVPAEADVKIPRKPPGFLPKLTALGWTPQQIERMQADAMRTAIDGKLDGKLYSVLNDGTIYQPKIGPVDGTPEQTPEQLASTPSAPAADTPEAPPAAQGALLALSVNTTVRAAPRLVLYIDCEPSKGRDRDYRMLEDIVAPLLPKAVEMHNKAAKKDEEKADYYTLIPYNRGPGYVASLLLRDPPTGVIVCSTRYPATSACLEVLVPMADVVVRALR